MAGSRAKEAYLANVDLAGSSGLDLESAERWQLSQMLEDWFVFCVRKVRFSKGCEDAQYDTSWAGDGGFALVTTEHGTANTDLARALVAAMVEFLELAPLVVGMPTRLGTPRPVRPLLRVLVAPISVHHAGRISNAAGPELNQYLKYERELTEIDGITVSLELLLLLTNQETSPGTYVHHLTGGRQIEFRPKRLNPNFKSPFGPDPQKHTFAITHVRANRGFASFHTKIAEVLEQENRWLAGKLYVKQPVSTAAFAAREPKGPVLDDLYLWCFKVLQMLAECWAGTPLGTTGVRLSYFRRTTSGPSTFELVHRRGNLFDTDEAHTGFAEGGADPDNARDAAIAWGVPIVIGNVTADQALWNADASRTPDKRIAAHVSYPIVAENDLVVALVCADFACHVFPHDQLCVKRDPKDPAATRANAVQVADRAKNDPIFQQLGAFASELRFGELEARYATMRAGVEASPA